jgi:hypothetical protein
MTAPPYGKRWAHCWQKMLSLPSPPISLAVSRRNFEWKLFSLETILGADSREQAAAPEKV